MFTLFYVVTAVVILFSRLVFTSMFNGTIKTPPRFSESIIILYYNVARKISALFCFTGENFIVQLHSNQA